MVGRRGIPTHIAARPRQRFKLGPAPALGKFRNPNTAISRKKVRGGGQRTFRVSTWVGGGRSGQPITIHQSQPAHNEQSSVVGAVF
jgi:hypothetical protein